MSIRHAEAAHNFKTAARLKPKDADALFHLGGSQDVLDRPNESLHAYRGARISVSSGTNSADAALSCLAGALERERKNEARIQNNIGTQLGKMNRWCVGSGLAAPLQRSGRWRRRASFRSMRLGTHTRRTVRCRMRGDEPSLSWHRPARGDF